MLLRVKQVATGRVELDWPRSCHSNLGRLVMDFVLIIDRNGKVCTFPIYLELSSLIWEALNPGNWPRKPRLESQISGYEIYLIHRHLALPLLYTIRRRPSIKNPCLAKMLRWSVDSYTAATQLPRCIKRLPIFPLYWWNAKVCHLTRNWTKGLSRIESRHKYMYISNPVGRGNVSWHIQFNAR